MGVKDLEIREKAYLALIEKINAEADSLHARVDVQSSIILRVFKLLGEKKALELLDEIVLTSETLEVKNEAIEYVKSITRDGILG